MPTPMRFAIALLVFAAASADAQQIGYPGEQPFTPTRMDWLVTTLQADLRYDGIDRDGYLLRITSPDPQTVLIYVRYLPNANREAMNITINAARQVIDITAKRYGWQSWLRIQEDVRMVKRRER